MPSSLVTRIRIRNERSVLFLPRLRGRGTARLREAQTKWWRGVVSAGIHLPPPPRYARAPPPHAGEDKYGGNLSWSDLCHAAHIGAQHIGNGDGAVVVLMVFHHGDQGAPDRKARSVEGMHEPRALAVFRTIARIHAAGLEIPAILARRDFAEAVLTGQPDFDVVSLRRRKAHVAGAERHHAMGEIEPLQHFLRAIRHALVFSLRLFGRRDRDQFHFRELVHADHAARVATGSASLGPKTRCPCRETQWQVCIVKYLVANIIGEWHFGRWNKPTTRSDHFCPSHVNGELELARVLLPNVNTWSLGKI